MTTMTEDQRCLADANRGIAGLAAKRYFYLAANDEHTRNDMVGTAMVALCRAAMTYRVDRGAKFATYAYRCCRNAIVSEICDGGLIPTPHYFRTKDGKDHRFRGQREQIRQVRFSSDGVDDIIDDGSETDPISRAQIDEFLDCVQRLPARERFVLEQIMGGWTQTEIGNNLGMSRHKVSCTLRIALDLVKYFYQYESS